MLLNETQVTQAWPDLKGLHCPAGVASSQSADLGGGFIRYSLHSSPKLL